MKISLNTTEAETVCKRIFERDLNETVTVEIKNANEIPAPYGLPNLNICEVLQTVRSVVGYQNSGKITAIKALRQWGHDKGFSIGLAEAKKFVESI